MKSTNKSTSKSTSKKIIASFAICVLAGCGSIPGSHLSGQGEGYFSGQQNNEQLEKDLDAVNVQIIDSVLVAQQDQQRQDIKNKAKQGAIHGLDVNGYEYRIGLGDVLTIGVWDHPELTIPAAVQRTAQFDGFRVQADGTFNYAYAPKMQAAGKTISEVRANLVKQLSRVIEDPQVDIKVVGFNSQKVYVTGEIKRPGVFPVTEIPLTLIDALNQAGGLTEHADWRTLTFTSGQKSEIIRLDDFYANGDISQNRLLKHGDVVHVGRTDSQKVFVLGDVKQAGSVLVNRYGLTLAEALSEAGGLNEETANANGVFVLRKRDYAKDGVLADVYQLYAQQVTAFVLADQFKLEPHDIVYVTTAPVARWNRLIRQLIPTISGANDLSEMKNRGHIF